jgi:ATP-dependent exoDNAse (exonuclease V) beta subunit
MVENYLKKENYKSNNLIYNIMFSSIKKWLDDNILEVISIEDVLISHKLKVAGRVDLIIRDKNNKLVVVDFKTSSKPKTDDMIQNYREQVSVYAFSYYEMYNVKIQDYVIIMVTEDGILQKFEGYNINTHILSFYEKRKKFKEHYAI